MILLFIEMQSKNVGLCSHQYSFNFIWSMHVLFLDKCLIIVSYMHFTVSYIPLLLININDVFKILIFQLFVFILNFIKYLLNPSKTNNGLIYSTLSELIV